MNYRRALALCVVFKVGRDVLVPSFALRVRTTRYLSRDNGSRRRQVGVSDITSSIFQFSSPRTSKQRTESSRTTPGYILSFRLTNTNILLPFCRRRRRYSVCLPRGCCCQTLRASRLQPTINASSKHVNRRSTSHLSNLSAVLRSTNKRLNHRAFHSDEL